MAPSLSDLQTIPREHFDLNQRRIAELQNEEIIAGLPLGDPITALRMYGMAPTQWKAFILNNPQRAASYLVAIIPNIPSQRLANDGIWEFVSSMRATNAAGTETKVMDIRELNSGYRTDPQALVPFDAADITGSPDFQVGLSGRSYETAYLGSDEAEAAMRNGQIDGGDESESPEEVLCIDELPVDSYTVDDSVDQEDNLVVVEAASDIEYDVSDVCEVTPVAYGDTLDEATLSKRAIRVPNHAIEIEADDQRQVIFSPYPDQLNSESFVSRPVLGALAVVIKLSDRLIDRVMPHYKGIHGNTLEVLHNLLFGNNPNRSIIKDWGSMFERKRIPFFPYVLPHRVAHIGFAAAESFLLQIRNRGRHIKQTELLRKDDPTYDDQLPRVHFGELCKGNLNNYDAVTRLLISTLLAFTIGTGFNSLVRGKGLGEAAGYTFRNIPTAAVMYGKFTLGLPWAALEGLQWAFQNEDVKPQAPEATKDFLRRWIGVFDPSQIK